MRDGSASWSVLSRGSTRRSVPLVLTYGVISPFGPFFHCYKCADLFVVFWSSVEAQFFVEINL